MGTGIITIGETMALLGPPDHCLIRPAPVAHSAGSRMHPDDVDRGTLLAADVVHLTGITPGRRGRAHPPHRADPAGRSGRCRDAFVGAFLAELVDR